MDSLQNPQQFQNSSIVQKSSKTGIFSNKRLLVIKNGYLYYFSKVPKGYKSHVPNILSTFTDLPKSSIEIKNILEIRLQSTKSSNLIIKFYLRDMIDRQDIRKSIDTHSYMLPQKKINTEIDQWKFTFTTVLQCRLWFNALIKLKDYFKNLDIKFQKFVSNFDKRNSLVDSKDLRSQTQLKLPLSINLNSSKNTHGDNSPVGVDSRLDKSRKTQPIKFDASKFIGSIPQKQLSPITNKAQISPKSDKSSIKQAQQSKVDNKLQKVYQSNIISEEDESSQNGHPPEPQYKIQLQIKQTPKEQIKKPFSERKPNIKQSHFIEPINQDEQIKIRQLQQQIRQEVKQQLQKKVRQELQSKLKQKMEKQKKQQITKFKAEVQLKQMKIKQLQTEIHIKHMANMEKQKQIQEQKKLLQHKIYEQQQKLKQYQITMQNQLQQHNKQKIKQQNQKIKKIQSIKQSSIKVVQNHKKWTDVEDSQLSNYGHDFQLQPPKIHHIDNSKPTMTSHNHIQVHQFSVQTDQDELPINQSDYFERQFNFSKEMSISKDLNLSKETKIRNSFFSDYLTSNRNTIVSERFRIEEDILPSDEQQQKQELSKYNFFAELPKIFESGISSSEKIDREIKLLRYINFVKHEIEKIVQQYIDKNHPLQCTSFQKGLFSFDLACAPGKVMNIGGEKKLIYSNKVHQNLKRTYKVYHKLQNQILKLLKTKQNFPVRVPLCTLVEYKGYTVLGKLEICCHEEEITQKDKYLKYLLPAVFYSNVQLSKTIQVDDSTQFYMIKVLKPFKLTNEQKESEILKFKDNFHLTQTQIKRCRNSSISIGYEKLRKQLKDIEDQNEENTQQNKKNLNNQVWVLEQVKLIRELRKIYKSTQPFSQSKNEGNVKSEFVDALMAKPMDLLGLIPSDIDFKTQHLQTGYFWSLVEFFLGIRMNEPIKQLRSNLSYRLLPISRTFHLQSLIFNQYCEKVEKYLSMNNMEAAQNCYKLLRKIPSYHIQASLLQIKILLKKKQYPLAQEKILYLKESLPLHDLRNIQINAFLIECYVFMGLQTQALKEIKSSLEYVEYLFGDRKNAYEQNLHLLMAQTFLKMGNIKESISLYKSLLKFGKIDKDQIIISFGDNLLQDNRFDPNDSIPFLIQCVEELKTNDKKIQLLLCVAKLYLRSKRKDKSIFYLQKAYEMALSSKTYQNLLIAYEMLNNLLPNQNKRQTLYKNFIEQVERKFFGNIQNCKKFNTINLYNFIMNDPKFEFQKIFQLLCQMKNQSQHESVHNVEVKDWQSLRLCGNILLELDPKDRLNIQKVKHIMTSFDLQKLIVQLRSNLDTFDKI